MGFHLPLIFALLSLGAVALASHAAQPAPQLYWNSVLPNTQMPRAISELLHPVNSPVENQNENSAFVYTVKPADMENQHEDRALVVYTTYVSEDSTNEENSINVMNAIGNGKQIDHKAIFLLEKDMRPGTTTNFQFRRNSNTATFLPRASAQSIPFSSNKLPEIFNHFSVKPASVEAKTIKQTIEECEAPGIKGEEKYCATSLESMVDFSTSKLGTRKVQVISTEVLEKGATMSTHKYTTMPGLKKLAGDNAVACHKQNYPYAVFYCHAIKPTAAYVLSLKGDDGVKVKAVVICHLDTSEWNPKHLAFQILKVKPGTIPICHFLPTDHIVWVPNHKSQ